MHLHCLSEHHYVTEPSGFMRVKSGKIAALLWTTPMPAIVRHILVKDKDLAQNLKDQIAGGADFAKLAKLHSVCTSARKGGELGEVKKGQLVGPIDRAVFKGPEHAVQGPIKSSFGFHVVQVKFRF